MRREWTGQKAHTYKLGRPYALWFVGRREGVTLLRDASGNWSEVTYPVDADVQAATYALRGGRRQVVPEAYYQELVAAGYGEFFESFDEYATAFDRVFEE